MAVTSQRRIGMTGTYEGVPGIPLIVRGTKYMRGWVMVGHKDPALAADRMMSYPTGGFDSAVLAANGGPSIVAGADANGGFRVIAKEPNVKFQIVDATAGKPTIVTVTQSTIYKIVVLTADVAAVTAVVGMNAVLASADASKLVDLTFSGTGAGLVAVAAAASIVHVRLLGLAMGEADASDTTVDDVVVDKFAHEAQIMQGCLGLLPDATTPPISGQWAWVKDNATVTADWAPLLLPVFVEKVSGGLAFCRLPHQRSF